jgi:hypothetical protein
MEFAARETSVEMDGRDLHGFVNLKSRALNGRSRSRDGLIQWLWELQGCCKKTDVWLELGLWVAAGSKAGEIVCFGLMNTVQYL